MSVGSIAVFSGLDVGGGHVVYLRGECPLGGGLGMYVGKLPGRHLFPGILEPVIQLGSLAFLTVDTFLLPLEVEKGFGTLLLVSLPYDVKATVLYAPGGLEFHLGKGVLRRVFSRVACRNCGNLRGGEAADMRFLAQFLHLTL